MVAITLRKRASRQPQGFARVRPGHPLSRYLAAAYLGGVGADPVTKYVRSVDGGKFVGSAQGLAFQNSGTTLGVKIAPGGFSTIIPLSSMDFTVYARVYVSQTGVREFILGDFTSNGSTVSIGFEKQASDLWAAHCRSGSGNSTISGGTVSVGWQDLVLSCINGTFAAYWNGRQENQFSVSSSTNAGFDLRVGGAGGYAFLPFTGLVPLVYFFNKGFSGDELKNTGLFDAPYALFDGPPQRFNLPGAGADTSLSGSATIVASGAGTLSTQIALAGSAAVAASGVGALSTSIALAGAASGQASVSAALTTSIALSGTASVSASGTASLTTSIALQGAASAQATGTAALSTQIALAGSAQVVVTAAASLAGTAAALSGSASISASASAALTTQIPLSGAAAAQASAAGALSTQIALAGAAQVVASASATLAGSAAALSATASIATSASAALTTGISLAGGAVDVVTAAGTLTTSIRLSGAASVSVSASASLTTGYGHLDLSAAQIYRVPAESRIYRAPAENRILKV